VLLCIKKKEKEVCWLQALKASLKLLFFFAISFERINKIVIGERAKHN